MNQEKSPQNREVFISYARKNIDFAHQLVDALKKQGREVWIDLDDIQPSEEWWTAIKHGIDEAHSFVVLVTPEVLASPVCTFEMNYALKNNKRIIPVMRNDVAVSKLAETFGILAAIKPAGFLAEILNNDDLLEMARSNWGKIERLNWINMRTSDDFDASLHKLIYILETDIGRVRLHTRLLSQSHEWELRQLDDGYLLYGNELREANAWLTVYGDQVPQATEQQRNFIQASLEKEIADEKTRQGQINDLNAASNRARRNRQIAVIVGAMAVVIALIAGLLTITSINQLEELQPTLFAGQETLTIVQNRLAGNESVRLGNHAQTVINAGDDPELALLLAIRAARTAHTETAQNALQNATERFLTFRIFDTEANHIRFSTDERYLLTDNILWDVLDNQQVRTYLNEPFADRPLVGNAISPDGQYVAIGRLGLAELWTLDGRFITQWNTAANAHSLLFSPDGNSLYVADERQITVYSIPSGVLLRQFVSCCEDTASSEAHLSPDGNYILSIGDNNIKAVVFDAQSGEMLYEFPPVSTYIVGGAFSLDMGINITSQDTGYRAIIASTYNEFFQYNIEQEMLQYHSRGGQLIFDIITNGQSIYGLSVPTNSIIIYSPISLDGGNPINTGVIIVKNLVRPSRGTTFFAVSEKYIVVRTEKGVQILTFELLPDTPTQQLLFACSRVFRDFTLEERELYEITSNEVTCPVLGSDVQLDGSIPIVFGATPFPTETIIINDTSVPLLPSTVTFSLSPTPTPTPTPTLAPTHTAQVRIFGRIIGTNRANLRSGAGQEFSIVGTIEQGTTVQILRSNSEKTWHYIRTPDGLEAWVSQSLIQQSDS